MINSIEDFEFEEQTMRSREIWRRVTGWEANKQASKLWLLLQVPGQLIRAKATDTFRGAKKGWAEVALQ